MNKLVRYLFNIAFGAALICTVFFMRAATVQAATKASSYMRDTADVLNTKTEREISDLNNHELAAIKTQPKIYVYTVKSTNNMNDEALAHLESLDNTKARSGIMILVSKTNQQICVATGKTLKKALPAKWCNQYGIDKNVRKCLSVRDYNKAVQILSVNLVGHVSSNSDLIENVKKTHKKDKDLHTTTISYSDMVFVFSCFIGLGLIVCLMAG